MSSDLSKNHLLYMKNAYNTSNNKDVDLGPLEYVLSATLGGSLTALAVCPLDVVKTRLQAQKTINGVNQHFTSTSDAFIKIARYEGILALWRGLVPTLLMTVPATTLYFTTYEKLRYTLTPQIGGYAPLVSGAIARIITATLSSPLEMLRTFAQSNGGEHVGSLNVLRQLRSSGIKSLWTGLVPTLWRDVPFSAIYWTLYEYSRKTIFRKKDFWGHFSAGAFSGSIAAMLTIPFDVIKTRQQMNLLDTKTKNISTLQAAKLIYSEEGLKSFFKGIIPRAARVAPACAIMIASYEFFKTKLRHRKVNQVT